MFRLRRPDYIDPDVLSSLVEAVADSGGSGLSEFGNDQAGIFELVEQLFGPFAGITFRFDLRQLRSQARRFCKFQNRGKYAGLRMRYGADFKIWLGHDSLLSKERKEQLLAATNGISCIIFRAFQLSMKFRHIWG